MESYIQPISTVIAGFIGGTLGALLNNCFNNRREKRQSEIQYLESQLKELYAPLLSLVEESNNMFERDSIR